MSAATNIDIIKRIDNALEKYYFSVNVSSYRNKEGQGKFKLYCDDNGFEQNDIEEELSQGADDCMLVDFDGKYFPLTEELDEKKRNEEIYRIIKCCADYAEPPPPFTKFNFDISRSELKELEKEYKKQMPLLAKMAEKEPDLWYFLALGRHPKNKTSFLTNLVDLYTKFKTELFYKQQQQDKQTRLTVDDWCANHNNFMIELRKHNVSRAEKLKTAMVSYSNRIMCRLQFTPTYKIIDDIQEISKYIISVPLFIKHLISTKQSVVPFCVDLLIAVRQVKQCTEILGAIDDIKDINDIDEDDDDEEKYNPNEMDNIEHKQEANIDYIGSINTIQNRLKSANIKYYGPHIIDKEMYDKLDTDQRCLMKMYQGLRHTLGDNNDKNNDENKPDIGGKDNDINSQGFNEKFYPQRKRFEIFIDRRNVNNEYKKDDIFDYNLMDKILIFEPPNDCDTLPKNHVAEWFMEAARTCLIPSANYVLERGKDKNKQTITAADNLCGQLLTFSYHVNKQNEIKCYILWNAQTMRFHGDYIQKVLPSIFEESDENKKFINGKNEMGKKIHEIQQQFDKLMPDLGFKTFCAQYN